MSKIFYIIYAFIGLQLCAQEPILIFTYVYNRPDFIDLHIETLNAFLKEPYRYIVFNDSASREMSQLIEETCKKHAVECYRVPEHAPDHQSAGHRHMDGIKYSLDLLGFDHNGIVMILDADMFLIRPLSIKDYLGDSQFIGGYQERHHDGDHIVYTSPCLVIIDMKNLPNKRTLNFDGGYIEGAACDVGAHTYYYFKNNPTLRYRLYTAVSKDFFQMNYDHIRNQGYDHNSCTLLLNTKREFGFEFHGNANFLHFYAGGSNWPGYSASFVQDKTNALHAFIKEQKKIYATAH